MAKFDAIGHAAGSAACMAIQIREQEAALQSMAAEVSQAKVQACCCICADVATCNCTARCALKGMKD